MTRKTVALFVLGVLAALAPAAGRNPALETLAQAVDRACGVRDCAEIRLFWYTDLEAAKAAAAETGRPILSLRLMGRLDEELSCANSRFFRTVYYKNRQINDLLRTRYVLHWRSVRPVPRVTIDFGDGTKLERTLTGNSIHYVLDSRGRLIDALPGLSGPDSFRRALEEAERAARQAARLDDAALIPWLVERHQDALTARVQSLLGDLRALDDLRDLGALDSIPMAPRATVRIAALAPAVPPEEDQEMVLEKIPTARDPWAVLQSMPGVLTDRQNVGGTETGSKMASELPILSALDNVSDDQLHALAGLHRAHIHLDPDSRAFLLRKHGVTDPAEAEHLIDKFETTVALDEVINEYRTGPAILRKLSDPKERSGLDLEAFNQWVYEEVFRTPLSDPWLGLAPEDVYVALPASTRTEAARPEE